jgi:predicted TIM-barrel fold metal-dependent hydrolase
VTPARVTFVLAALCACAVALALGATRLAGHRLGREALIPAAIFPPLDLPRVDANVRFGPGAVTDAIRLAEANGVRAIVNLSGGWAGGGLEAQLAAARPYGARVSVFMNPDFSGCCSESWAAREAARVAEGKRLGARGLDVPRALGLAVVDERAAARGATSLEARVPIDAAALEPIWAACEALALPVVVHAGDAKAFFEPPGPENERAEELAQRPEGPLADRARTPPWETVFGEFVRLVERHPKVTFVGAHFGNDAEDPAAVLRLMDRLPNLWIDTAARVPELGRRADAARRAILAHPDRVLFGTGVEVVQGPDVKGIVYGAGQPYAVDPKIGRGVAMARFFDGSYRFFETRDLAIPSPTPIQGTWDVEGVGLPRDVLEQVYHRNAQRLLGIELPPEVR